MSRPDADVAVLENILAPWADAEAVALRDAAPRTLGRHLARRDIIETWAGELNRVRRLAAAA